MTDKELIDAAGRVMGLQIEWHSEMAGEFPCYRADGCCVEWNPLNNDGDAFRLAVAAKIDVGVGQLFSSAFYGTSVFEEPHGCDPSRATRRAIVRAAAGLLI